MSSIDYTKIFGVNADNKYQWTDNDYKKGFQVINDNPPIRQIFDNIFNFHDQKMLDLNDRLISLEQAVIQSQKNICARSYNYKVGDYVSYEGFPNYIEAECIVEGTTANSLPTAAITALTYTHTLEEIIDGTCKFRTRYKKMKNPFGTILLWNGATYNDVNTGYDNPSINISGTTGLILSDYVVCNGKSNVPNTIGRTVRGCEPSETGNTGGVDSVTLSVSNLPNEEVTINGKTDDTSKGVETFQINMNTSDNNADLMLKTATGTDKITHDNTSILTFANAGATATNSNSMIVQTAHHHTINGNVTTNGHSHTITGNVVLGANQAIDITNKYIKLCYIMAIA